ncbi:MAG: DUF1318 domain-containing protein [Myxococcales bacterium]|nr:DUF1318 domain-containing protein [Myxococcales bacterium]
MTSGRANARWWGALVVATLCAELAGCVKAPDVVIVDRTTALEQQASGRFVALERELTQAGISPRPQPYTRGQLDAAGWTTPRQQDAIARLAEAALRDRGRTDALLVRRCIGEAKDGRLIQTRAACQGAVDEAAVSRLIERANRDRRQIWLYLRKRTRKPDAAVRRAWLKVHRAEVPCGGWIESAAGAWSAKKC